MGRLTGRYEMSGLACYAPNGKAILMRNLTQNALQKILDRLAAYEDAEEQGLLVRLPCKVGDTVYIHWFEHDNVEVVEKPFSYGMIPYMGETVFLTREEAEAALKEG